MAIAQSLDHIVVPADDIVAAEVSYAPFFGGMLGKCNGLDVHPRQRGAAKESSADRGGTYMDGPAGYVIQFITDGME